MFRLSPRALRPLLVTSALAACFLSAAPAQAGYRHNLSFENGQFRGASAPYNWSKVAGEYREDNKRYALEIEGKGQKPGTITHKARKGNRALRCRVPGGTAWKNGKKITSRSEFMVSYDDRLAYLTRHGGGNNYFAFSAYLENDWNTSLDDWALMAQVWQGPSSPPFALSWKKGSKLKLQIARRWGDPNNKQPGVRYHETYEVPSSKFTFRTRRWYDFICKVRLDPDGNGEVKVWVKEHGSNSYVNLYSRTQTRVGYNWNDPSKRNKKYRQRAQLKVGIYRGKNMTRSRTTYFDEIKHTDSWNEAKISGRASKASAEPVDPFDLPLSPVDRWPADLLEVDRPLPALDRPRVVHAGPGVLGLTLLAAPAVPAVLRRRR